MRTIAFVYALACSAAAALAAPAATCTVDDEIAIVKFYNEASTAGHSNLIPRIPYADNTVYILQVTGDPLPEVAAGIEICQGATACKAAAAALANVLSGITVNSYNPEPGGMIYAPGTATFGVETLGVVTVKAAGNITFNAACQITRTFVVFAPLNQPDIVLLNTILGTALGNKGGL